MKIKTKENKMKKEEKQELYKVFKTSYPYKGRSWKVRLPHGVFYYSTKKAATFMAEEWKKANENNQ